MVNRHTLRKLYQCGLGASTHDPTVRDTHKRIIVKLQALDALPWRD
jgi:hypothetical protein